MASPSPTTPQMATLTIKDVATKQGEAKHGPWKLWLIETEVGNISTFDSTYGTLAEGMIGATVPMKWEEEIKARRDGDGVFTARTLVDMGESVELESPAPEAGEEKARGTNGGMSAAEFYRLDPKQRFITAHGALKVARQLHAGKVDESDLNRQQIVFEAQWMIEKVLELAEWTPADTPPEVDDGIPFD